MWTLQLLIVFWILEDLAIIGNVRWFHWFFIWVALILELILSIVLSEN